MPQIHCVSPVRGTLFRPTSLTTSLRAALATLLIAGAPSIALSATDDGTTESSSLQSKRDTTKLPETVVVGEGIGEYKGNRASALKTLTPILNEAQSVTIVPAALMRDTATQSMADAVRYVPGVGFAQGEGNRDTPILRGNATTADFFVDGMRDDVQYFRDIYNIERVEVLKGPNAMLFGRGGTGGLINRVTKQADGNTVREASLIVGSWNNRRGTLDIGNPIGDAAAFRVTGLYEDSESYRDDVTLERWGVNPTAQFNVGERTRLVLGYEHFRDERVADRGIPSFRGRPLATDPSTFFGSPEQSPTHATVDAFNVTLDHEFADGTTLRNRTRYADYDKFYQNVFPGAVNAAGTTVSISAYNQGTKRENLFNQTDLLFQLGTANVTHDLLVGAEIGQQDTDNLRLTGFFTSISPTTTSIQVPVGNPRTNLPLTFAPNATDANNTGTAESIAVYVQDQITFSPNVLAVLGLRYDHLDIEFRNNRNGAEFAATDTPLSPRAGLIYKPSEDTSLYASYSLAYQPRAGEQLSSLSLTNQALDPEEFENVEVGFKWDVNSFLSATAAIYRLDRSNVAITDPADPTRTILVDGQRTNGVEIGVTGALTDAWKVMGGYAYQDGEITRTLSATAPAGATLAQLPEHTFSLWNRVDFNDQWGVGVGAIARSKSFTSTDNLVELPGYVRLDGAVFYAVNERVQMQLNIENLLDKRYYPNAHSNTNITSGSPLAVRLGVTARF